MAGVGERVLSGEHEACFVLNCSLSLNEITALENGSLQKPLLDANLSDVEHFLGGRVKM